MLQLPKDGFNVSVTAHNVKLAALADWIEGSVAFATEEVSQSDVKDALIEGNVYRDQSFASERIESAWNEMRRRCRCLGASVPYTVEKLRVLRTAEWKQRAGYSFCLALSLQVAYRKKVSAKCGRDFTEQGELFERLTAASLEKLGWSVHTTGWSKARVATIKLKVTAIAKHLGEPEQHGAIERWTKKQAKDVGLDVVCSQPFEDGWGGRPLCLVQCASGDDWDRKLHTPDLQTWGRLLDFTTKPGRGLSMPFAPLEEEFRHAAGKDGMMLLLDRHRLLAPTVDIEADWISADLSADLNKWTEKRVDAFPLDSE